MPRAATRRSATASARPIGIHARIPTQQFLNGSPPFLGAYYLALALMNGVAAFYLWHDGRRLVSVAGVWHGRHRRCWSWLPSRDLRRLAVSGSPPWMPRCRVVAQLRQRSHRAGDATASARPCMLVVLFVFRAVLRASRWSPGSILNLSLLFMGLSMTDPRLLRDRHQAGQRADRGAGLPAGLLHLAGDVPRRWRTTTARSEGLPPLEKLDNEKVLVWPDLVYTELICMVALTALLIFWAIAPAGAAGRAGQQRQDAQSVEGPVVLPGLAGNAGLLRSLDGRRRAAEPDHRRADGDSVSSTSTRRATATTRSTSGKFAYLIFQFGFLELWVTLIVLGTFLRGPNWNFFGPYEYWDAAQGRGAEQRQPVASTSGSRWLGTRPAARRRAGQPASCDRSSSTSFVSRVRRASCWCWATSSPCRRCWR